MRRRVWEVSRVNPGYGVGVVCLVSVCVESVEGLESGPAESADLRASIPAAKTQACGGRCWRGGLPIGRAARGCPCDIMRQRPLAARQRAAETLGANNVSAKNGELRCGNLEAVTGLLGREVWWF